MSSRQQLRLSGLMVAVALVAGPGLAAGDWKYIVGFSGWITGLDGETRVRGVSAPVETDFSDMIEDLETGARVRFEAENGRWKFLAGVVSLEIGQTTVDVIDVDVDLDQTILELGGGYELSDSFAVLVGGRYIDTDVEFDFRVPVGLRVDRGEDWIDPFVGGRFVLDLSRRSEFRVRGDVGGFGVGSDFTWNLAFHWLYRAAPRVSVAFGYRVLDIDFEEGEGGQTLRYDVKLIGPQIGLAYHF